MKKRLPVNIDDLALTPRETKFVCEYITNGYKAEDAAKSAGLLSSDAGSVAGRLHCATLLSNEKIKEAIRRTKESFVEPYRDIHYAKIQEVLEIRAFYDPLDFFKPDGEIRPLDDIAPKLRHAIDGVETDWSMGKNGVNIRTVKYKLADKDRARKELRELHELKEEKKDIGDSDKRSELFSLVAALAKGIASGVSKRAIEEEKDYKIVEKIPSTPASDIIKKIKDGDYAS
jgi:phage terminase small subunit